ncbi:hypothetical protein [Streptomyces wuyuanensis]|uniref:Transposase n=1 Tax=Streptomyces wuyuanensis TaxID=1196353 RepID=A0A1G9NQE7_9ACTN|nr:hypothetical protein [Streptomyces wuyuanensis]SDL88806.1 hypothetical protein SAMN05444921_10249 [Streptomyces wuyuanensis]
MAEKKLRKFEDPFVALGPSGVAIRDRLKHPTDVDDKVLRLVGEHLGRLASLDLKARCADGLDHNNDTWAARKQGLTAKSSSRWAGALTKATHDQWALSRRCQLAHIQGLEAGVRTLMHRLSQPIGEKGTKRAPGGYRSKGEWFRKSRRLHVLEDRLDVARVEREAGVVHVVRGGRRLINNRHNLDAAQLTEPEWRQRWEAERWFLAADGESGKRYGNETIRVTPDGEVSIKLPTPLAHLANAEHGRYVLTSKVAFAHPTRRSDTPSVNCCAGPTGAACRRRPDRWTVPCTPGPDGGSGRSPLSQSPSLRGPVPFRRRGEDQPLLGGALPRLCVSAYVGPQEFAVGGEGRRAVVAMTVAVIVGVLLERGVGLLADGGGPAAVRDLPADGAARVHGPQRVHTGEHGDITPGRDRHRAVRARPGGGESHLRPVPVQVTDGQLGVPALHQHLASGPVQHLRGVRRLGVLGGGDGGDELSSDGH